MKFDKMLKILLASSLHPIPPHPRTPHPQPAVLGPSPPRAPPRPWPAPQAAPRPPWRAAPRSPSWCRRSRCRRRRHRRRRRRPRPRPETQEEMEMMGVSPTTTIAMQVKYSRIRSPSLGVFLVETCGNWIPGQLPTSLKPSSRGARAKLIRHLRMSLSENMIFRNPLINHQCPIKMAVLQGVYPILRQTQVYGCHRM